MGQKFCPNRSVSYGFRDINIFYFSAKIQEGRQKWRKIEIFQLHIEYSTTTMRVKISVIMALSLTVSEILTFFIFPQKFKKAAKSGEKLKFFNCT